MTSTEKAIAKEFQDKKQRKDWKNKKYSPPSHDKDKTNVMTRRPMTSRYQKIFFGH